jgi:3-oxo-5-alpha-steroid 4-dehydrogenase 1
VLLPVQLFFSAPYGRHVRSGWRPQIPNRLGWMAMEIISPIVFATLFLVGPPHKSLPMWVFFAVWMAHYVHRSLIFPSLTLTRGKTIPVFVVGSGMFFNLVNGGLNGYFLGWLSAAYPLTWLMDVRFVMGIVLFAAGATLNLAADYNLIALRRNGQTTDYSIPRGKLFARVSCPSHLGEIIEWSGFALMCWNLAALSFAVWTAANLIPRAIAHHAWYRRRFAEYPPERRAVVPYLL